MRAIHVDAEVRLLLESGVGYVRKIKPCLSIPMRVDMPTQIGSEKRKVVDMSRHGIVQRIERRRILVVLCNVAEPEAEAESPLERFAAYDANLQHRINADCLAINRVAAIAGISHAYAPKGISAALLPVFPAIRLANSGKLESRAERGYWSPELLVMLQHFSGH